MRHYVIRGGSQGKTRLAVLARVMEPFTGRLLDEVGPAEGMSCLDVGCGGGDVAREMARWVGASRRVVGVDGDPSILALDRGEAEDPSSAHVRYVQADVSGSRLGAEFDLVYARFLLTHVRQPEEVLAGMMRAAREGAVVAEDIEFAGHVCYPACRAFARYVELYREVVRIRGGDAEIGPRLPSMFLDAGVEAVQVRVVQPVALEGEAKDIAGLTLEAIADAVVAEGLASAGDVEEMVAELAEFAADPRTLMSLPRIFQVLGPSPRVTAHRRIWPAALSIPGLCLASGRGLEIGHSLADRLDRRRRLPVGWVERSKAVENAGTARDDDVVPREELQVPPGRRPRVDPDPRRHRPERHGQDDFARSHAGPTPERKGSAGVGFLANGEAGSW